MVVDGDSQDEFIHQIMDMPREGAHNIGVNLKLKRQKYIGDGITLIISGGILFGGWSMVRLSSCLTIEEKDGSAKVHKNILHCRRAAPDDLHTHSYIRC